MKVLSNMAMVCESTDVSDVTYKPPRPSVCLHPSVEIITVLNHTSNATDICLGHRKYWRRPSLCAVSKMMFPGSQILVTIRRR